MKTDRGDRSALFGFALLGALKALALIAIAEGIARGISGASDWVAPLMGGALLRAALVWVNHVAGARAAIGTKQRLRRDVVDHALRGGARRSLAVTATVGLDELDNWYRTVLPAIATTATVPLLIGARILFADWLSALIIVLTVPLVPVFMALVGMHTKEKADAATATIERLANHVAELARGLPVLVGLGRVEQQSLALTRISQAHRVATVKTLRTAFMSSLVLELLSTISVAVVAVFVGIRLLHGEMTLEIGLIALILAPECFAPFRDLGSAFHASQAGLAAKRRVAEVLAEPTSDEQRTADGSPRVSDLSIRSVHGLSFELAVGSVTAIVGPSGSGKSSVLGVLAGTVAAESGSVAGIDAHLVAYVPQHPHTVGDTVRAELALYADGIDGSSEASVDQLLHRFALDGDADPASLSPGELRRVAVARALLRVQAGATLLVLDEPTAHLDAVSALVVEDAIEHLRGSVTIVVASHEQAIVSLADRVVSLGATAFRTATGVEAASASTTVTASATTDAVRELLAFLRPTAGKTIAAALLGAAASLSGMALLATSGWLIVQASQVDAIMYLLVAIVGVRFFGLGRAGLRYAERLVTHDGALESVAVLRRRLWSTLAETGLASRALASGDAALDFLVATPERVLQLVPRVITPLAVAFCSSLAVVITTAILVPADLGIIVACVVVSAVIAPIVSAVADRAGSRAEFAARSVVVRGISRVIRAAADVRSNGIGVRARNWVLAADATATAGARKAALATGIGSAMVVLATGLASLAVLASGEGLVGSGAVERSILAVIVLLPLTLVDPLLGAVEAAQLVPSLATQLASLHTEPTPRGDGLADGAPSVTLTDVAVAWPGSAAVFENATATAQRGQWLVVEGPSGSGKSTLVAALLGFLPAAGGRLAVTGRGIAWAPQESHIFDSTVRGNLLLAGPASDDELTAALATVRLDVDLDAKVGSEGGHLSGGQRQRLAVARALLTKADVVLLDEPTAHLDADAASDLMADLRTALADCVVVLVTHHADELRADDVRLQLGALADRRKVDGTGDGVIGEDGAGESGVTELVGRVPAIR